MKISELFDMDVLEKHIKDGYVRKALHPTLPLAILNYTEKTAFASQWDDVTIHCRGLIYEQGTGILVARGPRKFFNYGEPSAKTYPLDTKVRLTRKEDGSLGIIWGYMDVPKDTYEWGYATRGSFTSEQALYATEHMEEVIPDSIDQWEHREVSAVDEIVYPDNRIVLDYKGRSANIHLGEVDNRTGLIVWRPNHVLVKGQPAIMTLGEALALPIPEGEEGFVLDILDEYLNVVDHLKLKGEWYRTMHAAIFGLTEKRVWEAWHNFTRYDFIAGLPDELQPWAEAVCDRFDEEYANLGAEIWQAFVSIPVRSRKEFAIAVMKDYSHLSGALFAKLDGNTAKVFDWIDLQVKPKTHVPYNTHDTQLVNA